jgi:hypothetical protein
MSADECLIYDNLNRYAAGADASPEGMDEAIQSHESDAKHNHRMLIAPSAVGTDAQKRLTIAREFDE